MIITQLKMFNSRLHRLGLSLSESSMFNDLLKFVLTWDSSRVLNKAYVNKYTNKHQLKFLRYPEIELIRTVLRDDGYSMRINDCLFVVSIRESTFSGVLHLTSHKEYLQFDLSSFPYDEVTVIVGSRTVFDIDVNVKTKLSLIATTVTEHQLIQLSKHYFHSFDVDFLDYKYPGIIKTNSFKVQSSELDYNYLDFTHLREVDFIMFNEKVFSRLSREIRILKFPLVNPVMISDILRFRKLRELNLNRTELTQDEVNLLTWVNFPKLKCLSLSLGNCYFKISNLHLDSLHAKVLSNDGELLVDQSLNKLIIDTSIRLPMKIESILSVKVPPKVTTINGFTFSFVPKLTPIGIDQLEN